MSDIGAFAAIGGGFTHRRRCGQHQVVGVDGLSGDFRVSYGTVLIGDICF